MAQTIDKLLNLVPEKPDEVLQQLQSQSQLAGAQDSHGYSLLHAAASYNHPSLLRELVKTYNVNVNTRDEDGETALFAAETVDMARVLVEELSIDVSIKNEEGQTAADKFDAEQEYPLLAAYLRQLNSAGSGGAAASIIAQTGNPSQEQAQAGTIQTGEASNGAVPPPPLPQGVKIDLGTMGEDEVGEAPDPEFRRRIDELASRPDFQSEENQRELRNLVQDALTGMKGETRDVRQRTE